MKKLLYHVSDKKFDVLEPMTKGSPGAYTCFSMGCFISHFGQYIYICDFDQLRKRFKIYKTYCGSLSQYVYSPFGCTERDFFFKSKPIEWEYRIYEPIPVDEFCLDVVEQYNHLKGVLVERMHCEIRKREEVNWA